jgi:hypothetical protein
MKLELVIRGTKLRVIIENQAEIERLVKAQVRREFERQTRAFPGFDPAPEDIAKIISRLYAWTITPVR